MADNRRLASSLIIWPFLLQKQCNIFPTHGWYFEFFFILSFSFCLAIQYQSGDLQLGGADPEHLRSGQHSIIKTKQKECKNAKEKAKLLSDYLRTTTDFNYLVWPFDPSHKRMGNLIFWLPSFMPSLTPSIKLVINNQLFNSRSVKYLKVKYLYMSNRNMRPGPFLLSSSIKLKYSIWLSNCQKTVRSFFADLKKGLIIWEFYIST